MRIVNAPHNINVTPIYRVKDDSATDNEKSISEVASFFARYLFTNMKLISIKNIKSGSDQAHTDTKNNGIEKRITIATIRERAGIKDTYLNVSSPAR